MRKKNQIPKYYNFNPKKIMKIIQEQSLDEKSHNQIEKPNKKTERLINMLLIKKLFNLLGK